MCFCSYVTGCPGVFVDVTGCPGVSIDVTGCPGVSVGVTGCPGVSVGVTGCPGVCRCDGLSRTGLQRCSIWSQFMYSCFSESRWSVCVWGGGGGGD